MPNKGWQPTAETRARYRAAWVSRRARAPGFWDRVQKTATCWLWPISEGHYGEISVHGKRVGAHRYAYESVHGPIPDGLDMDHLCRNPRCVNPDHLEPVTPRENTLRGISPIARNARAEFCIRGHHFATDATVDAKGHRRCRPCHREYQRKRRAYLAGVA